MVSDSRGALMRSHKLKVSTLLQNCKNEGTSKNMELKGKPFEASNRKNNRKKILDLAEKKS